MSRIPEKNKFHAEQQLAAIKAAAGESL